MSTDTQLAELLGRNADLFAAYEQWANGQIMLLAGTIDDPNSFDENGGKTGPLGYYPVVNVSGQTIYVPCLARLQRAAMDGVQDALSTSVIEGSGLVQASGTVGDVISLKVEAATDDEAIAGISASKAVTPKSMKAASSAALDPVTKEIAQLAAKALLFVTSSGSDDRAAIQTAIDEVAAQGGGQVYLTNGVYRILTPGGTAGLPCDDGSINTASAGLGVPLAPEPVVSMPYGLKIPQGVRLVGANRLGTRIIGPWSYGGPIDTNQMIGAVFGETYSQNINDIGFENIRFENFFIPWMVKGVIARSTFRRLTIQNCAIAAVVMCAERVLYEDVVVVDTPAGITHGGWWTARDNSYAVSVIDYPTTPAYTDKTYTNRIEYTNSRPHTDYDDAIDAFFDTYFFKSSNSMTGAGYTSVPTASASAGSGSGATFVATVDLGTRKVSGVTVTAGGAGYTTDFPVVFSGGGGTGAQATALVSGGSVIGIAIGRATAPIPDALNQGGRINAAPYRGICGVALTYHSRYGRPNFNNDNSCWFVFRASRMAFNGGIPYRTTNKNMYLERIGFSDAANFGPSTIMGVARPDPYRLTGRPVGVLFGESGSRNTSIAIYADPVAALQTLALGDDTFLQLSYNPNFVPNYQPPNFTASGHFRAVNVDSADNRTLDWYLESGLLFDTATGLFVEGSASAGSASYSLRRLSYTRTGNTICLTARIAFSGHTGSGALIVKGLPFVSVALDQSLALRSISGIAATGRVIAVAQSGTTQIALRQSDATGAETAVALPAAGEFYVSGTYQLA